MDIAGVDRYVDRNTGALAPAPHSDDLELNEAIAKEFKFFLNLAIKSSRDEVLRARPGLTSDGDIGLSSAPDGGNLWGDLNKTGPPLNMSYFDL